MALVQTHHEIFMRDIQSVSRLLLPIGYSTLLYTIDTRTIPAVTDCKMPVQSLKSRLCNYKHVVELGVLWMYGHAHQRSAGRSDESGLGTRIHSPHSS